MSTSAGVTRQLHLGLIHWFSCDLNRHYNKKKSQKSKTFLEKKGKKSRNISLIRSTSVVQCKLPQPAGQQHAEEVPGARGVVLCRGAEATMDGREGSRERWQQAPNWGSRGLSDSVGAARGDERRSHRLKLSNKKEKGSDLQKG